jgi:hypothetical protein
MLSVGFIRFMLKCIYRHLTRQVLITNQCRDLILFRKTPIFHRRAPPAYRQAGSAAPYFYHQLQKYAKEPRAAEPNLSYL